MEDFYRNVMHVRDEEFIKKVCPISRFETYKKNDVIIAHGEKPTRLYFMVEGGVRCCYPDEKGHEVIDCFMYIPGEPVMPLMFEQPSVCNFVTYKPTKVVALPLDEGMALIQSSDNAKAIYEEILRLVTMRHWEIKSHLYGTAAQRYTWFCTTYPNLVGDVSDKHIASFLGMTPISLSRLRHDQKIVQIETEAMNSRSTVVPSLSAIAGAYADAIPQPEAAADSAAAPAGAVDSN